MLESTLLRQQTVDGATISPAIDQPWTGVYGDGSKRTLPAPEGVGEVMGERRPQESEKENDSDGPGAQLQTQRSKRAKVPDYGSSVSRPAWCAQGSQHVASDGEGSSEVTAKE